MGLREAFRRRAGQPVVADPPSLPRPGPNTAEQAGLGSGVDVAPAPRPLPPVGAAVETAVDTAEETQPVASAPAPPAAARPTPSPALQSVARRPVPQPTTPRDVDRAVVRQAYELLGERTDELVRMFYAELFVALGNQAASMFPPSMVAQRAEFGRTLVRWVIADDADALVADLDQLGGDHRKFGVEPHHYDLAGRALVNAWRRLLGDAWTPRFDAAVAASYDSLATIMIGGALARTGEPAAWEATVVAHERLLPDFAVLRVRPDEPYPFRAGQYLSVQAPTLRNEWRQMSIASAPRQDNSFDLQVRAVSATGVSGALVMRTSVGDRLLLGSPRGHQLVVEPGSVADGLLCICSGTGAAPITAVVESLLGWDAPPDVYAYVGARTSRDLYPVETLAGQVRSRDRGARVQVSGVLTDEPAYSGLQGRVDEVVPKLRPWAKLGVDVLVAGPDLMVDNTVAALVAEGVPSARIRVDRYASVS